MVSLKIVNKLLQHQITFSNTAFIVFVKM